MGEAVPKSTHQSPTQTPQSHPKFSKHPQLPVVLDQDQTKDQTQAGLRGSSLKSRWDAALGGLGMGQG